MRTVHTSQASATGRLSAAPQIELVPLAREPAKNAAEAGLVFGQTPRPSAWRRYGLFVFLFVLPVAIAGLYLGFIASDIFISETKFVVRSASGTDTGSLAAVSQGQVNGQSDENAYAVVEYVTSRDAARSMELDHGMREMMARDEADIFSRYPSMFFKDNQEYYYRAYRKQLDVSLDPVTGIVTLVARAYRPEDAKQMAAALVLLSENFVNGLNSRANRDAQDFAKSFLAQSELDLANVERNLAAFRNTQMVVDPNKESAVSLMQLGQMATEISRMEAALNQQISMVPNSPSIKPLEQQIRAYRDQIEAVRKTIVGNPESVASKIKGYELLILQRNIAGKKVELATAQFEKVRQEAQNRRIYLQPVVQPNLPDMPLLPYRFLGTLLVAALCFAVYRIVRSLVAATMEHQG